MSSITTSASNQTSFASNGGSSDILSTTETNATELTTTPSPTTFFQPLTESSPSIHERDIPSMAAVAHRAKNFRTSTNFSFCLTTSLAFFKRLTWEQTPWLTPVSNFKLIKPISPADANAIVHSLRALLPDSVSSVSIQNALLLGFTYPLLAPAPGTGMGMYPHPFIIFPHAETHPATDEKFLRIWHDQIVKPAFDRAWKDSGVAEASGAELDGRTSILPPSGTRTAHDALPASGFLVRLRSEDHSEQSRALWPRWDDSWGGGREGRRSHKRAEVYGEAWDAMMGSLKDHPDLPEYRNPVLLAVCRAPLELDPDAVAEKSFEHVAREWDAYTDSRYMVAGSFRVVLDTVVGIETPMTQGEIDELDAEMEDAPPVGDPVKRVARGGRKPHSRKRHDEVFVEGEDEVGDGDGDAHRSKRRKHHRQATVSDE